MGSLNIVPDGEARPSTSPFKENIVNERFFVLSLKEGSFVSVSPIIIHKTILAMVGDVKTIKKCKNGKLLIETANAKQADLIKNLKNIGEKEVTVASHLSLNQSKGVISESEFQNDTEADIMEYLKHQNVSAVRRISIRKDGQYVPTKHLILTFNTPTLPKSVLIAYINCPVRPYIPNPLRCYKCQRFGHSIQSCRGKQTCAKCAEIGHASDTCQATPHCANCKGDHPAYARSCPRFKDEKEIQAVKVKQNVSFGEARKIVADRTPKVGVSYASLAKPTFICTCGQKTPSVNITEIRPQSSQQSSKTPINNSKSKSPIRSNNVQHPNIENKINTPVKPNQPPNRSCIPKINQNPDVQSKVTNSQLKSVAHNNKFDESPGLSSPSTSGIKPKKKSDEFGKETKAAKKARILTQRKKDPKLKQALKKRTYSKSDFLNLASKTNEDDVDMVKGYPTDESDILTDNSEDTLPASS
ncbi:hypothetical protein AVEN_242066-1 [Araneus ventricosus]|uniref:CCHC-type domain-containing protein n=1 Tax=Araneus ventricosus TaxID=182803 RepID=A0A4Y2V2F4_ARAVE|nr:hypothetical protein AVEN_242066-1 [Araneus ventricosus]